VKKALICGISGQDGPYLAKLLLENDYAVVGTSRNASVQKFENLEFLGIKDRISLESMAPNDFRSVLQCIQKHNPDEIYNLSGQSSVAQSFNQPMETLESIVNATNNILETLRLCRTKIKFYNAGSSECFGNTPVQGADENTPFRPRSPYAVAKSTATWQVANYREAYGLDACTGILFNHESPFRPDRFVTKKIVKAAIEIKQGKRKELKMGNIKIQRDWGLASEYVEAMWLMLQQPIMDDYVIATGKTHTLEMFIERTFKVLDLDYRKYVRTDSELLRTTDILYSRGKPQKAKKNLGWKSRVNFDSLIIALVGHEMSRGTDSGIFCDNRATYRRGRLLQ
jgi:GDPmannose 4,6-dehydratase